MPPFVPLRYSLPLPPELTNLVSAASLDTLLDDVGIVSVTTGQTDALAFDLQATIAVRSAIELAVPAAPGVQVRLFAGIDPTQLTQFVVAGGWRRDGGVDVELSVPVELRLGIPGLRPAIVDADGPRPDPARPNLMVQVVPQLMFSTADGVSFEVPSGLNMPPVLLGSSGFALEIHGLTLRPEPFEIGVVSATLHFPKSLHPMTKQLQVNTARLTSAGFSGTIQWVPPAGGAVVPLPGDLAETLRLSVTGGSLTFADSVLTSGLLTVDFNDLVVPVPGLDGTALLITAGTGVSLKLTSSAEGVAFAIEGVTAGLRVAPQILRPIDALGDPDPAREAVELALGQLDVGIGPDGRVFADLSALTFELPRAMIGDSGVIVEALGITAHLDDRNLPLGRPAGWRGVHIGSASLKLPGELGEKIGTLSLTDAEIGTGGFTGAVAVDWNPALSVDVGGMTFALAHADVEFRQNALVAGSIEGIVDLPFFDGPVGVSIGLSLDGGFAVALAAVQPPGTTYQNGLVTIEKEDLLSATLESLRFLVNDGVFTVSISGTITPLVGDVDWPSFRVQELSIDSQGHVKLAGGWLDLREQYVLSLGGFQLEIARIGFGSTEDGRRWIGFSGGLKLVDGITAGASVEGLRVTWDPQTGNVSLTLSGIGVEFEVPGAVYFKGYVAMTEPAPGVTRFDGQITLDITAIGLQIEAQLVVGYDRLNEYAFFAIYIGVELPAGIPLGQTGLGLFGLAGLFALQMEPNRKPDAAQPELPWYGIQPGPSWYHALPRIGVAELRKWVNREGSLALGAGVTIGTVSDNGYLFAGKFLLGIIFPGPILFIEGRANLLKERASLRDEPVFRTLVVLDARAGTFLMGLDAQYAYDDSGALIKIGGGAEAFFDFNDLSAWHIYLGIDEPRERRIRAFIFESLFEANAYFMLDARRLKTGAWIGYAANWSFGPLRVVLEAWIEGRAELSFKPLYFTGSLWLHGKIEASVFGFGFGLGADARISAAVFDPYHILAELSVSVNLPWPLPDFNADIRLEWGPEPLPPLLPVPLKEISIEHLKVTTTWPLPTTGTTVLTLPDADGDGDGFFDGNAPAAPSNTALGPSDASPIVPLDARPRITFGRPLHDAALVGVNPSIVFPNSAPEAGWEWIGDPSRNQGPARIRSSLTAVALERWNGSRWEPVARKATTANAAGVRDLYGSWAPVPQLPAGTSAAGTEAPTANVKLWLWSKSAYDFSRRTGGAWDDYIDRAYPNYPCIDMPTDREECIDFSELNEGESPAAPWHAAATPAIEISWRVPPAPVVRVASGRKGLCFPDGADVEVHLGERTKQVRISVQYDARKETTSCADFRERPEGDGNNPRQEGRMRILVLDRDGEPAPQTRVVLFPVNGGSLRGLDAGFQTIIDIPPSDYVNLDLTRLSGSPRVEATSASGLPIDRQQASGPVGTPQHIRLERKPEQPKIARVTVTAPVGQVALHRVCYGTHARRVIGHAHDRNGRELGAFADTNGLIDIPGRDVVVVRLDAGAEPFCLTQVCVVVGIDQADRIQREEMARHVVDQLARWQADDEVLEPWSRYRLKLVTTVEVRDFPHDAAFNITRTITQCAYFRTQGPPGLASYSVPVGHPQANAAAPAGPNDPPQFDSGVHDLERYVQQTVPPTVPAPGEKPSLPRPVYRAYDVGVRFNENYVDSMYRLAGRDLSLALYDNNNQPVRDHLGRLLTTVNRWGRTAAVELSASEERWIAHINATTCADIDRTRIARDLTLGTDAHVLDPGTVYEGRLLPLLCRDLFSDYAVGAQARGTGARLTPTRGAGWIVRDEGTDQGPSQWIVREAGNPPARHVEQTTNVSAGAAQRASAFVGGTLLVREDDPRAGVPQGDRAANWTDYRLSTYVRSLDDDLVGVGVRWTGRNGYLFTLDRELGRRRLAQIVNGAATILAEATGGYDVNRDYLVQVEAVGDRIRVFVDGAPVFDLTDNRFSAGSVALYCGQNAGGQFRDVSVDDLRTSAPIVYRFKFTTSDFTDFQHHMHSHQGLLFRAALPDLNGVAAALAQAVALAAANQAPSEAEARAYSELATKTQGTQARQPVARVDVTRVEQGGAAIGLLVRTADPIDWRRTSISLSHAPAQAFTPEIPNGPRLVGATFAATTAPQANDESMTVLFDNGANLAGCRIQSRSLPSADAPALADGTVLFRADLNADQPLDTVQSALLWQPALADLAEFTTLDAPGGIGAAAWAAGAGVLRQDGNYRVIDPLPLRQDRQGTYAIRTGAAEWGDVRVAARIRVNAVGAVGIVFRFQDVNNHYRFALDGTRNVRELTRRVNGVTQVLFSQPSPLIIGHEYEIVVEALAGRLRVTMDGSRIAEVFDSNLARGAVGFYTYDHPLPRFDRIVGESLTRSLGPWTILDHGDVQTASHWQIERRLLAQDAALFASPPSLATLERSGSVAVAGDTAWTDVRVVVVLEPSGPGSWGIVFRWQDPDNHYRLLIESGQRRLIRRASGVSSVLWSETAPTGAAEVAVEAIGNRLRAWIDDTPLFDLRDEVLSSGQAGVLALDSVAGNWSAFEVRHVQPNWEDWHRFDATIGWRAAGRRFRIFTGRSADSPVAPLAGEEHLFQETTSANFRPRLRAPGVDLRLVDANGQSGHTRRFLPDASYVADATARVLRAADGTGMLVFIPGAGPAGTALPAGEYRLQLTYRRDNTGVDAGSTILLQAGDASAEAASIDVPWSTSP